MGVGWIYFALLSWVWLDFTFTLFVSNFVLFCVGSLFVYFVWRAGCLIGYYNWWVCLYWWLFGLVGLGLL